MPDVQSHPVPPRQCEEQRTATGGEAERRFRLISELGKTVETTQIEGKIMDTPVQFSIREILTVSGEVAGHLHYQTRKRRIPIEDRAAVPDPGTTVHTTTATSPIPSVNVNSADTKSYYALPSGHAKVTLDDQLSIHTTLDNGSKVNMMRRHIFERMGLPIDTEIHWAEMTGYIDIAEIYLQQRMPAHTV